MPEPTSTSLRDELAAMKRIGETLEALDPAARSRALRWLVSRSFDNLDDAFGIDDEPDDAPMLAMTQNPEGLS